MKRKFLALCLFIFIGLVAVWVFSGRFTQAIAQEKEDSWSTSAELPAGTNPATISSSSDQTVPLLQNDQEVPEGLVSWRVTGSALTPRENNVNYTVGGTGGCSYVTSGDAFTVWNTTVNLPQGAVVDTLRMYYYDTSNSNSSAWFTVYDLYGDIVTEWVVSSSGNFGNSFNDSAIINHTIDYSIYSYLINWRPVVTGSSLQLCGFRIFYSPPPFGLGFLPVLHNENP